MDEAEPGSQLRTIWVGLSRANLKENMSLELPLSHSFPHFVWKHVSRVGRAENKVTTPEQEGSHIMYTLLRNVSSNGAFSKASSLKAGAQGKAAKPSTTSSGILSLLLRYSPTKKKNGFYDLCKV